MHLVVLKYLQHMLYVLIQKIVPYLVYYTIRFNDTKTPVESIAEFINTLLDSEDYYHRLTALNLIDFMKIWLAQDKGSVQKYFKANWK